MTSLNCHGPQYPANEGANNLRDEADSGGVRGDTPSGSIGSPHDTNPGAGSPSAFTIHYTNIRGLFSNFTSVEHHLASSLPNILLLSETQVSSDASTDPLQISHYNLISRFRPKGGVCAYYNINTPVARLMNLESPNYDVIWLKICLPTTTVILCFCYCPYTNPDRSNFDHSLFFEYLSSCHESLQTSHPLAEVLYLGDFNVHHTEWLSSSRTDRGGTEALEFSILHGLDQLIQQPTRVPDRHDQASNTLDLFFTSNSDLYSYSVSSPLGSSDHCLVAVTTSYASPPPLPSTSRRLWHYDRIQRSELSNFFTDFPWGDCCFRSGDSDCATISVTETILAGMEAYVPYTIKSFSPSKPWFDHGCSRAVQAREHAYQTYVHSRSDLTYHAFIAARNRCKAQIRRAKKSYVMRKKSRLTSSPTNSSFWSLTKSISNNFCKSGFPPLFRSDRTIAVSPTEKANLFGSLFSSNSSLDDSNVASPPNLPLDNPMPPPIISERRVRRALSSLKTNKAYGPDGIPPRILREFAIELAPVLCRLFRLILKTGTFPSSWKHSLVQPVPKKGDRSNPSNYRPIALTSAISKVFESILNSHFLNHLEKNLLLSDHQYGFRKARSTGDLLSYLTHLWSSSLRDFGESFVVTLDISKAFDRVWHKALLAKLPAYGFTPSLCKLISSYLSCRSISVVVDGAASSTFQISSGVPQGSVLSPTLFLLFINDLLQSTSIPSHSYADDTTCHFSSKFQAQPSAEARSASRTTLSSTINVDLERVSDWGRRNCVKFNASKTCFIPISLSNVPSNFPINFENVEIAPLPSINILGLELSHNLSWRNHIEGIAKSASKKLGVLFRCRNFFSSSELLQLYVGLIRPCMEYCSHVWGGSPYTRLLDRVEAKAFRLIGNARLSSSLDSLSLRRRVASLTIFYRLYFGYCSSELRSIVPPPLPRPRNTRQAASSHDFCVRLSNVRLSRHSESFIPTTSRVWNSLPQSVFPDSFNISVFKQRVCRHLRGLY